MTKMLKIAFLNLLRNKRRTLFNVVAITVSLSMFLFSMAMWHGEKVLMYDMAVQFMSGHIQIHSRGFDRLSNIMPVDITINDSPGIEKICRSADNVTAVKPRITFMGFVGDGRDSFGGIVHGVDPESEKNEVYAKGVINNDDIISRFIQSGNEVLLGKRLADLFGLTVGDEFIITSENKFKQPNVDTFTIVGLYNTGAAYFDENNIYIPIDAARKLLAYSDREVNVIHVKVKDDTVVDSVMKSIIAKTGRSYEVFSWHHFAPELVDGLKQDQIWYIMTMGVLLFLMIFGLINTMSMNVHERYREIGSMRAIGFGKIDMTVMLIAEAVFTGLISFCLAMIFGGALNYYMANWGFAYPQDMLDDIKIPFTVERFLSIPLLSDVWYCLLLAIVTPALGALLPSYRALRKSIVDELHHIG